VQAAKTGDKGPQNVVREGQWVHSLHGFAQVQHVKTN